MGLGPIVTSSLAAFSVRTMFNPASRERRGHIMRINSALRAFGSVAIFLAFATAEASPGSAEGNAVRLAGAAFSDARQSDEAEAFVRNKIDAGFAILNDTALSPAQRRAQFREFLLSIVDSRRVGLFTLGTYARNSSQDEIDRFVAAYTDFSIALYQSYFDKYKGETLRVTGSTARNEDDVIVNTDVVGEGTPQYKLAFRVRRGERGQQILTDVQIEGAWLVLNQRSDFGSYLQQHGGMLDLLSQSSRTGPNASKSVCEPKARLDGCERLGARVPRRAGPIAPQL
jgi:phospholipid transport system substrate-binding protein